MRPGTHLSLVMAAIVALANTMASTPARAGVGGTAEGQKDSQSGDKYWVEAMRQVHARFKGEKGTFAQFGDSITVSRAFWFTMWHEHKNVSPEMAKNSTG